MADIIRFPRPHAREEAESEALQEFDSGVAAILSRRDERPPDEPLLSDDEFRELLARLEKAEQEEEKPQGMGILFWLSCLFILW